MKYEYKLNIIAKHQNGLIVPFVDESRGVRWWQFVNQHGVHMTKVVCIDTGYSVSNNQYCVGGLSTDDLDKLVAFLHSSIPKMECKNESEPASDCCAAGIVVGLQFPKCNAALSDCCAAGPENEQGICPACKDHCEWVTD